MKTIGGPFGRSPFGPLREHILKVKDCIELLPSLMKAFLEANQEEIKAIAKDISKEEHAADQIKKRIREHLSKSLFASIHRADVLAMLKEQDNIADVCEEVGMLLAVRKTELPKELAALLIQTVEEVTQTVLLVCQASEKLVKLEEDSSDRAIHEIYDLIESVQKKEWETDSLQQLFLEKLFTLESQMNPIHIYFLMTIIKQIGEIANHADNTGDCMRRILAR
ncbi:MAG: TIGR00153 family protein [Chlamydiae bacterium]|nr:TIGR00153 family protein [Chlamydiota bacterium]MBI3266232.1 TIGR00153 family protein [Chlamydiota bacterium]